MQPLVDMLWPLHVGQRRLYALLNDPMPVIGFDDDAHRGFFDVTELDSLDDLFEEVLTKVQKL